MAFELGFLVGSLALLAIVVYVTRFRGPSLPHETMAEGQERASGDADGNVAAATVDGVPAQPPVERCELCGENRATRSVNDLAVCAECDDELLA
ncbi:MAG: hypothetical protein ABEJ73_03135 [Haloplanus sp.]